MHMPVANLPERKQTASTSLGQEGILRLVATGFIARASRQTSVILMTLLLLLGVTNAGAQVTSGSLSGVVHDSTGAVVPEATVVLTDEATTATRRTVSNSSGAFTFVAVPAGSYTLAVNRTGFSTYQIKAVTLDQGENRTVPQISLNVGTESAIVSVSADTEAIPVDTGQLQTTLNSHEITELSIQGRNAAELIKVMPGLALNTGLGQTEFSSLTTGTTSGPGGSFSASGTVPNGGLAFTLDGANITDPGLQGAQVINVNQDMTAQVSILNSAFGAEYAKGPILFQAISKSGGSQFHGNVYFYVRDGALNANDAYFKSSGVPRPDDRQMYPGFTVGGPVIIPGLNFNRARNKLFFFSGYEYNYQHPAGTIHELFVPTAQMLAGDFDPAYLASLGLSGSSAGNVPCAGVTTGTYCPTSGIVNGVIPKSQIDPNALAMAKLFPAPNQDPATHNGHNFVFNDNPAQNRFEIRERLDYNPSEKSQITGSFTQQNEGDLENFGIYYYPGATVPYPSQLAAHLTSQLWTGNYTRSFGASATNNLIVSYATHNFPLKPTNPAASDPATIGFTASGPFQNHQAPQVPNLVSYSCYQSATNGCFPGLYAPTFTAAFNGGAFGNKVQTPAVSDDFSKVIKTHTIKVGAYWDLQREIVTSGAAYAGVPQGQYEFETGSATSTNNPNADLLLGHASSYSQVSAVPLQDIRYSQYSLYAQDQWKVKKLTLTYGLRLDHEGQWYPANHPGFAVWDPSTYSNAANAPAFTGLTWNAKNTSVPNSGWTSSLFRPLPRVGVAYDLFGTGKTVIRGGYGLYLFQVSYNDVQGAYNQPLGIQNVGTPALNSFADAANYAPSVATGQNGSVTALMKGDNRTPYTQSWNVTVSQQGPINSVFELSYSGNATRNGLLTDTGASNVAALTNLNKIPVGALFGPDPITGITYAPGQVPGGALQDYRPYSNYQVLNVTTHGSYSNYNALVTSWQKQRGPVTFQINYTFSKALGIRDGQTDNGTNGNGFTTDAFNLKANYGTLGYDRTHIFNSAYIVQLPSPIHGNRILQGAVNGWQLSGITQIQSGPSLQPNTFGTLNAGFLPGVTNQSILGTDSQVLRPLVTCDPRSKNYFNPACFASPTIINQNGPAVFPTIKGPAFFDTDLGAYKNFAMRDKQNIQFRLTAFNFINHPLPQFGLGSDVNLQLTGPNGTNTNTATTGRPQFEIGRRVVELAVKYVF
jgi:Carboxypeptidase regulatory-like domain